MPPPVLATKLYAPLARKNVVARPRLIVRLNENLPSGREPGLTLISAPAGFGKTTLVGEWVAGAAQLAPPVRTAWLSLDAGDNDPARFLTYLIAALQTIAPSVGAGVLAVLQAPQAPAIESILTVVLNDLTALPAPVVLVLDDYHVIEAAPVNQALTFLLDHLPPQLHLVLATREDPDLPLARLRARGRLTELRAADLRFTAAEAADFLNAGMGLRLAAADIAALEARTEGWIAGLQLAALALRGPMSWPGHAADAASFIRAFSGSHHFVLDYLVEEVLHQQSAEVQTFLLSTSILERLCGPLCDALLLAAPASGQATLAYIERANLFIIPLDNERRWYRYHHLFAELLRQRLPQSFATPGEAAGRVTELHLRASQWYEDNGLDIEAFHHAAAANDIDRAERLIEGRGIPLHFRGAVVAIIDWLGSLPVAVMSARPSLWWRYASLQLVNGHTTGVDEKLNAAEAGLASMPADDKTRLLTGRIAAARAVLALTRYQPEVMLAQSHRALEYLPLTNVTLRANAHWTLGYAYLFRGDRVPARQALLAAVALAQPAGDIFTTILATIGLAIIQEGDNQFYPAAETWRRLLQLAGDQPLQIIYEVHLGLARVLYEWNDLEAAEQHGRQSLHLARQYDRVIDRYILCEVFLGRVKLARGDLAGAAALLAQSEQSAREQNFMFRLPEVAAAHGLVLLRQGHVAAAAQLAETYKLPLLQAHVHLAQGDPAAALAALEQWRAFVAARGWQDEVLKVWLLQALAHQAGGDPAQALHAVGEALALAEPGGFIRTFVDEGPPMAQLLSAAGAQGLRPDYCARLLAALAVEAPPDAGQPPQPLTAEPLVEPLSPRELEVLRLMAQGRSNGEISAQLFLALSTVKGHNREIFGKLQVQRRTEAVARARALGLL